jgi:quercetin dioxygenase-like cupin family protein
MQTIIHTPETAPGIRCFGGWLQFFLKHGQSDGWLMSALFTAPPDNGPPVHTHRDEDEILTVMEGRFAFFTNGIWTEGGPGTTVYLPRDKPHAFRNIGTSNGKLHVLANSAGMESCLHHCEEPFHLPDGPDMEAITAIAAAHGIRFV